jgi:thiosulfate/3-mercaptopyruvate sulfurtransferase
MTRVFAGFAVPLLLVSAFGPAQPGRSSPPEQLLVTAQWLADHRSDPDLVILHLGPRDGYTAAHIPGARLSAGLTAPDRPGALAVELPPDTALARAIGALGITNRSRIIIYTGNMPDGRPMMPPVAAFRAVSTFFYAGIGQQVAVLDGGLKAWQEAGQPIATGAAESVSPTTVTVRPRTDFLVDATFLQGLAGKPGHVLVDARAASFHDGTQADSDKKGHIPGAKSLPMESFYTDAGKFKDLATVRAMFAAAGIAPSDTVVAYCHIGIYANTVIAAARMLGHPVKFYDGSFQDWARRGLPTEPAGPGS